MNWVCTICFLLAPVLLFSAQKESLYSQYENIYRDLDENDERALPVIALSIAKAKVIHDHKHLLFAYEDALYHSSKSSEKLKYADSIIITSLKLHDNDLICKSYLGKGIVYYFNFKNYSAALEHYLQAHRYAQKSSDDYLKYKIKYHLGVVKNYLGYYEEASLHFRDCSSFFEKNIQFYVNQNAEFNNTRGLLNSLHQLAMSNIYLNRYNEAEKLVDKGFKVTKDKNQYLQEKGYFSKCAGIINYQKGKYSDAEKFLIESVKLLEDKDFASIAVAHYYLGKIYFKTNRLEKGILFFNKVDSNFIVNQFMLPEIRSAYNYQIQYAKNIGDSKNEIYNMGQLLKVDKILAVDFPYLSSRMHREYDTANLIIDNKSLEKSNRVKTGFLTGGALLSLLIIGVLVRRNRNQKNINKNYEILIENLKNDKWVVNQESSVIHHRKNIYDQEIVDDILLKLQKFEQGTKFLEKGLTLRKLASHLKTNGTHLSYVINEYKKINFNMYLKTLRINHITKMMYSNSKFLNYTVESLAKECGISSRQVFSDQFYEINGLRPKDFIRKRLKELKDSEEKKTEISG